MIDGLKEIVLTSQNLRGKCFHHLSPEDGDISPKYLPNYTVPHPT
jgi:hypothetical protein